MRATEFLTEGGNVFDGTSDIDQKFAPNLTTAINKALTGTGINVITVGSAATPTPGKMSGDFDVMADETAVAEYFGVKDAKSARKALADYFRSKGFDVAQSGTNVHVKTPIGKQFAQVDIMVVPQAEKISKLHIHNLPKGSPYKGYNKQLAIHFLSKMKGYFWSAWQGLYARTPEGKKGELVSNDVDTIAKTLLGPQATAADLGSVESIMSALPKDQADQLMTTLKADPNWKEIKENDMKASEFMNEEQSVQSDLQQISTAVKADPNKAEYAKKFLSNLLDFTKNIVAKVKTKPVNAAPANAAVNTMPSTQPVKEAAADIASLGVDNLIKELNLQIDEICKTVQNCDPIVSILRKKITELKKTVQGAFTLGKAASEKETQKYFSDLEAALKPLVAKVSSNPKISSAVKSQLEGWFNNAVLRDKRVTKEQMIAFLKEAAEGHIIDMKTLVTKPQGNILDYVNPKYKDIFMMFKNVIFDYKPGGSGANLGPAEVALTLLGNPAEKADVGDIRVDGVMYELKGGSQGKGGRLNGKEILKPTSGGAFIKDYFSKKLKTIQPMWANKKGKKVHKYNWNATGIERLNQDLITAGYRTAQRNKILYDFLLKLWQHIITNHEQINGFEDKIIEMIDPKLGAIDPKKAIPNATKLLYQSYQLSDGQLVGKKKLMNILVINSESLNYKIIKQEKDIDKIEIKGGIDWNDANTSASPQLYIQ